MNTYIRLVLLLLITAETAFCKIDIDMYLSLSEAREKLSSNNTLSYHFKEIGSYFGFGFDDYPFNGGFFCALRSYEVTKSKHGYKSMQGIILGPNAAVWAKLKFLDIYFRLIYALGQVDAKGPATTYSRARTDYEDQYFLTGLHHHFGLKKQITPKMALFVETRSGTDNLKLIKRRESGNDEDTDDVDDLKLELNYSLIFGIGYTI